ncbi:ferric uptake regulator, Fur family [Methylocella silvestris BL2]|uniref:Ferric uptake regulation protein n=1 Tax=Methylocella silvestris (strain DSM 15510 / CIP 108128 / LMG 27833 / NCIMB 13906 / BL2) TaxID=395965 RepID=B8EPN6_METSB|nr:Fur family transcriptional regulator [Methylocella silvestris]ACK50241.1 ferric uptake regulator, Fur family [Methylocella silvestris BL2]
MNDSRRQYLAGTPALSKAQIGVFLKSYGLRATRQRRGLVRLLFGKNDRHVTAESLANEARAANTHTSMATVYNVLNLFAQVGLIRSLAIEGDRAIFDTNTSDHSHYFFEDTKEVRDIESSEMNLAAHIEAPDGYEVSRVDVVVTLRRKDATPPARAGR